MPDYSNLLNESDIRGVALPGVPDETVTLTADAVRDLAGGFVRYLSEKTGKPARALKIAAGGDSRLSTKTLRDAALEGVAASGAGAFDCGMTSTPAMFMATILPGCDFDGSVMITASHLPWHRNGMKFFTKDGGLEHGDVARVIALASSPTDAEMRGETSAFDVMGPYARHLRGAIVKGAQSGDFPLKGLSIAVDAGNGAGGFFARDVLTPLGADVSASRFLEPDGRFPNHIPNPENAAAMDAACAMTLAGRCDLGVIFDADVDRAGAVGASGKELNRNRLIGVMTAVAARDDPGCTIVTDSTTSDELSAFIAKLGCRHHRFKRGYRNVIGEAKRLEKEGVSAPLAMETSGHAALSENYFLDDGAYLCAKLIVETVRLKREGRALEDLIAELGEPLESKELRPRILEADYRAYGARVLEELAEYGKSVSDWTPAPDNYEGVRYSVPKFRGWFMMRMSLHEPLMPINVESAQQGGADAILAGFKPFLDAHKGLAKL